MREVVSLIPYVARSVVRARVRGATTVAGAALAVGLFAFVEVAHRAVERLSDTGGDRQLVVFQDSRFCPMTSELPLRYGAEIAAVDGVEDVLPTLVFVNSCRANLDLVALHGVPPADLERMHDIRVLDGGAGAFEARAGAALVGSRLARRRGLSTGDRVRLGQVDVRVEGVFESGDPALDNLAFVPLDQLALARGRAGSATQFFVRVAPGHDPLEVAAAIDRRFETDVVRTRTRTRAAHVEGAVAEISEVIRHARLLGYLSVAVVALILAHALAISRAARKVEFATLEAIGLPAREAGVLVLAEGAVLGCAGAVAGLIVVLAVLYAFPITVGVEGFGIDFRPDAGAVGRVLLVVPPLSIVAALPAAIARDPGGLPQALRAE